MDFLNTVEWRGDPSARGERFTTFDELVHWAAHAGVLDRNEASRARAAAVRQPRRAAQALKEAIQAREALLRLVTRGARDAAGLAIFNRLLGRVRFGFRLVTVDGAAARVTVSDALRLPLDRLLVEAMEFLTSGRGDQVSRCGNERCGWMFVDTSRNRTRRWCSMAGCGNTAKVRAHRQRHRRRSRRSTRH